MASMFLTIKLIRRYLWRCSLMGKTVAFDRHHVWFHRYYVTIQFPVTIHSLRKYVCFDVCSFASFSSFRCSIFFRSHNTHKRPLLSSIMSHTRMLYFKLCLHLKYFRFRESKKFAYFRGTRIFSLSSIRIECVSQQWILMYKKSNWEYFFSLFSAAQKPFLFFHFLFGLRFRCLHTTSDLIMYFLRWSKNAHTMLSENRANFLFAHAHASPDTSYYYWLLLRLVRKIFSY